MVRDAVGPDLPIIGVGAVSDADSAWRLIEAGANLIQVYTGLIYRGPSLVRSINRGLLELLEAQGLANIGEVVGRASAGRSG